MFVVFILSIPLLGTNGNCMVSNFDKGIKPLFNQCCIRGVECTTPMGMKTNKTCEFYTGPNVSRRMDIVLGGVKKVFGNINSELLRIKIVNSNANKEIIVMDKTELNPIFGKIGFIRCEDNLFLAHYIDTGTKRIWYRLTDSNSRREIARCNID